jgi:hypothetical protein
MEKGSSVILGSIFGAALGFTIGYYLAGVYGGQHIAGPFGLTAALWAGIAVGALAFVAVAMFASEVFDDR